MDTIGLPKTRAEAKATGAKHYFTGAPCKHGHVAPRKTKGACVDCLKDEWAASAASRSEYFQAYNQRESVKDKKNAWYLENKEQVVEAARTRPREVLKAYQQAWKERNALWVRADTKARRRKHREATPEWLTRTQKAQIRHLYQIAITMSRTTGEQYVVDHIYPLRSEVVCGLHVPWNLRILTQADNLRKSNVLPGDSEAIAFPPKK